MNESVASTLERVADLLEAQDANPFRVHAYRGAGETLRGSVRDVAEILESEGLGGLEALPGIGPSLASAIEEVVHTGRLGMLKRLEGEASHEALLRTVPGIGDKLAHRIFDQLGVETLEELEQAAHDGRLAQVEGFGPRRTRAVRAILSGMLNRASRRRIQDRRPEMRVSVRDLLSVDAEYTRKAARGQLRTIAPRRFNPQRESWLPILHAERGPWHLTALYSNTGRAHELGRTREWVVIYVEIDGHEEQFTVVTENRGPQSGRRVVRGRERECSEFYRLQDNRSEH